MKQVFGLGCLPGSSKAIQLIWLQPFPSPVLMLIIPDATYVEVNRHLTRRTLLKDIQI